MLDAILLRAILGVVFISLSVPIMVIMLLRGSLYIAPEISHAALGGAALGILLQTFATPYLDSFLIVLLFCIATSILISHAGRSGQQSLGTMLSVSLVISVTLYAVVRGYLPIEKRIIVDGYLLSDLLLLSDAHILSLAIASAITTMLTLTFYGEFIYICFDMEAAEAFGLKTRLYDSLLFSISAMSTAIIVRAIGVLPSVSLLVLPAATSRFITHKIDTMLLASLIVAALSGLTGIVLSLYLNIPTSGAISLSSTALFLSSYLARKRR